MVYAILAAGEGSRLAEEGYAIPKPLVKVGGEALIERLIRIFLANDAQRIVVIVNEQNTLTQQYLQRLSLPVPLEWVVKSTHSSMHSLYALRPNLEEEERFCVTTVDTIFSEQEFARYIHDFRYADADGLMAVTRYVDDEKPLYVQTDNQMRITGFYDTREERCDTVSGGIYCLRHKALATLDHCMTKGMSRMRNFQRQLVADGLALQACEFTKIIDVDHRDDVAKAEELLKQWAQ